MTLSLSPYIPHRELMTYAKFNFFSSSAFGETYVQMFSFNPIWLPFHLTNDVRASNKIFSICLKFCIDPSYGQMNAEKSIFKVKIHTHTHTHTHTHKHKHKHTRIAIVSHPLWGEINEAKALYDL